MDMANEIEIPVPLKYVRMEKTAELLKDYQSYWSSGRNSEKIFHLRWRA